MNLKKLSELFGMIGNGRVRTHSAIQENEIPNEIVTGIFLLHSISLSVDLCALCGKSDVIFFFINEFSSVSLSS